MKKRNPIPDRNTLSGFLKTGKTIDWIAEKWNVTPQTVKAWLSKFQIHLPGKKSIKTRYQRNIPEKRKECPVCQSTRSVNFIVDIKHWYCVTCDVEYDHNRVIYVYDECGILVEVIGQKPGFWDAIRFGRDTSKSLIKTVTI
jgi:hypothetical protein